LELDVPAGTRAAPIAEVPDAREFMLSSGSSIVVESVEDKGDHVHVKAKFVEGVKATPPRPDQSPDDAIAELIGPGVRNWSNLAMPVRAIEAYKYLTERGYGEAEAMEAVRRNIKESGTNDRNQRVTLTQLANQFPDVPATAYEAASHYVQENLDGSIHDYGSAIGIDKYLNDLGYTKARRSDAISSVLFDADWDEESVSIILADLELPPLDDRFQGEAAPDIGPKVQDVAMKDPAVKAAFDALKDLGELYVVGGAVRDMVLGKDPKDIDLMVQGVDGDTLQAALEKLPGRVDFTGKSFGVYRYRASAAHDVEIALPRTEQSTGEGHKDFEVVTDPSISVETDLQRRDFTGNAMAVNLKTGELVDPHGGADDLTAGVINTVSPQSFAEDPLRILRAFGQVSRHGLTPSPEAIAQMGEHAASITELPQERVAAEMDKILGGSDPSKAIRLMQETGVMQHVLPEVARTVGFDQHNPNHDYTLDVHLEDVLRRTAHVAMDPDMRWAALLHDIGKPDSFWLDEKGIGHFYKNAEGQGQDHQTVGADMARVILNRLKFPNDRIDRIVKLVDNHMFPAFSTPKGARKFLNKTGDLADDLITLREADMGGKGEAHDGDVTQMRQLVADVRQAKAPTDKSMLAINGRDLIDAGIKPGPHMGRIFDQLVEQVIDDPSLNTPEVLIDLARQLEDVPVPGQSGDTVDDSLSNDPLPEPTPFENAKNRLAQAEANYEALAKRVVDLREQWHATLNDNTLSREQKQVALDDFRQVINETEREQSFARDGRSEWRQEVARLASDHALDIMAAGKFSPGSIIDGLREASGLKEFDNRTVLYYMSDTEELDRDLRGGPGDPVLDRLYKDALYDVKPRGIHTHDEMDDLVKKKGWKELFRGVGAYRTREGSKDGEDIYITGEENAEAFRSGKYYAGLGIFGNGSYTSTSPQTARGYATIEPDEDGNMELKGFIRMALAPDAVVRHHTSLNEEMQEKNNVISNLTSDIGFNIHDRIKALEGLDNEQKMELYGQAKISIREAREALVRVAFSDLGRYSVTQGIDVFTTSARDNQQFDVYHIVLNRGAVAVQDNSSNENYADYARREAEERSTYELSSAIDDIENYLSRDDVEAQMEWWPTSVRNKVAELYYNPAIGDLMPELPKTEADVRLLLKLAKAHLVELLQR